MSMPDCSFGSMKIFRFGSTFGSLLISSSRNGSARLHFPRTNFLFTLFLLVVIWDIDSVGTLLDKTQARIRQTRKE